MPKFRKLPVVIEAVQWTGNPNAESLCAFFGDQDIEIKPSGDPKLVIHTLEGTMLASIGDWIIRGVKGELYPCKPEIFAATYESADVPVDPTVIGRLKDASGKIHEIVGAIAARRLLLRPMNRTMTASISKGGRTDEQIERLGADAFESVVRALAELGDKTVTIHECSAADIRDAPGD